MVSASCLSSQEGIISLIPNKANLYLLSGLWLYTHPLWRCGRCGRSKEHVPDWYIPAKCLHPRLRFVKDEHPAYPISSPGWNIHFFLLAFSRESDHGSVPSWQKAESRVRNNGWWSTSRLRCWARRWWCIDGYRGLARRVIPCHRYQLVLIAACFLRSSQTPSADATYFRTIQTRDRLGGRTHLKHLASIAALRVRVRTPPGDYVLIDTDLIQDVDR